MTEKELQINILRDRSSANWQFLIETILSNPALISSLIKFTFGVNPILAFRSSWILDNSIEKQPSLIKSDIVIDYIITEIVKCNNYSVIRSIVRLLSRQNIPINNLGLLVHQCFQWLASSQTPVAVKVHCMQILLEATISQPELKNELKLTIENQLPYGSAGFLARGKRILKALEKIN